MHWIAPSEKDATNDALEKRLWEAADQLRANSGLTAAQYSQPVLGLIFLRFAEARFEKVRRLLEEKAPGPLRATRLADPNAYQAEGVLFLAPEARYQRLLTLPEGAALGRELNEAMRAIERDNPQLSGVLSKTYEIFDSRTLVELLKLISSIPTGGEGDTFGRFTNISWEHSRWPKASLVANFTRQPAWYGCWWKSWDRSTAGFSIRLAGREVCSFRVRGSCNNIAKIFPKNSVSMGRNR
jgi:hypothetical protein